MHLYKIAAQISLIISILNLVLAAPIGVDETVIAEGVAAMPNEQDGEAASDRPTNSPSLSLQSAMGSPQHSPSPDGSSFSGHPTPPLSPTREESAASYAWLLDRPPRLNLYPPPETYLSASDGSLSSQYFSASDGSLPPSPHSITEGLAPSHHLTPDGSPPPPPPPTGTHLHSAEIFSDDVVRRLKIVGGVVAASLVIAPVIGRIVASQIDARDFQDS